MSNPADRRVNQWLAEERPTLTHLIIGAFFRVDNQLGFWFLEQVCAAALGVRSTGCGGLTPI
jgi:hypothetical protein